MKRFVLAAASCLALVAAAPAVRAQGGGQGRMRMTEMLFKDITLTDAQKTKSDSIIAHYREMMGPPMGGGMGGGPPDSAAMAKRRETMMKEQADLRAVLDAEQQKVFDKNAAEMRERMSQRRPSGR